MEKRSQVANICLAASSDASSTYVTCCVYDRARYTYMAPLSQFLHWWGR